ncbi:MAG: DUF4268 domain-containing protein [Mangrovibacterium sp.]
MYTREEAKKLRKQFWIDFAHRCESIPELMHRKKKWILYDTSVSGVELKFQIGRHDAMVILELNNRNEDKRLEAFELLQSYKIIVEEGFEEGLIWELCYEREKGEQVSRAYVATYDYDIHRRDQWHAIFDFFIENMLKLEANFFEIQDILKENLNKQPTKNKSDDTY